LKLEEIARSFPVAGQADRLKILNGINLEIKPGETVALIGSSGVGKTTLLYISAGLCCPDSGRVYFRGQDMAELKPAAISCLRRSRIGLAFQNSLCLSALNVIENLTLPLRLNGESGKESILHAESMLDQLGLLELRKEKTATLSGGQRRRLGLGRALIMDPELLLADEPTADLDQETGEMVSRLIYENPGTSLRSALIVTHDEGLMQRADRTVELKSGGLKPLDPALYPASSSRE
jgi:ABC-type lipoprotein export system ATPase subunit